jgi:hypothetical protein
MSAHDLLAQDPMSGPSTVQNTVQRFEPNVQMIWGQVIVFSGIGGLAIALLDYFKFAQERSLLRALCVCVGGFVAAVGIYWLRSGRHGDQTLVANEKGITVENKDSRALLPWSELAEISLTGDSVLRFYNPNSREVLRLDNLGFTPEQWKEIKGLFESRGKQETYEQTDLSQKSQHRPRLQLQV